MPSDSSKTAGANSGAKACLPFFPQWLKCATGNSQGNTKTGVTNTNEQSNYQFVKQGWGSRPNFQYSFGLKMDPDGIEEGNAIIEAFRQQDAQEGRK